MDEKYQIPQEGDKSGLPALSVDGQEREIASAFSWREGMPKTGGEPKRKKKKENGRYVLILLCAFLAALGSLGLAVYASIRYVPVGQAEAPTVDPLAGGKEKIVFVRQDVAGSGILTTPEIYGRCADSVVSLTVEGKSGSGVGSGFIMTSDGYLATANHVVEGYDRIRTILSDGREFPARVVASDALTDLALLKIEATELSAVEFGKSGELLVGERVTAIGTPLSTDYAGSVCSGEISYLGRTVRIYDEDTGALTKKMTLIQTDAALNSGNSGCPLFDEYGRVVGIVTMKLGEDTTGIGFAIPSDGARAILFAMMRGEELTDEILGAVGIFAPKLGIMGARDSEDGVWGIRIHGFSSGAISASAMLKEGDLILRIDGVPVTTPEETEVAIRDKKPGDAVKVTVLRFGQTLSFEVLLTK